MSTTSAQGDIGAPPLWERQPGEPSKAYHAFAHYRDLGPTRSSSKAYRAHKQDCDKQPVAPDHDATKRWQIWSAQFGWVERASVWDADVDRQARDRSSKVQIEARERHARLAQGALTALSVPIRATLDALAQASTMQALVSRIQSSPDELLSAIGVITRAAQAMPGLILQERLALGLTTESVQIDDQRSESLSNRIVADSEATDLAIALLHRLSGASESPTVGFGLPGGEGELADGPTPEPTDEEVGGPGAAPA